MNFVARQSGKGLFKNPQVACEALNGRQISFSATYTSDLFCPVLIAGSREVFFGNRQNHLIPFASLCQVFMVAEIVTLVLRDVGKSYEYQKRFLTCLVHSLNLSWSCRLLQPSPLGILRLSDDVDSSPAVICFAASN